MTIYFLEPGKNVIRKILVKDAKTEPWNPVVSDPIAPKSAPAKKKTVRTTVRRKTKTKPGTGKGKVRFYGAGGECSRVVYLISADGSKAGEFGLTQQEILRSVGRLRSSMEFSVIVMVDGKLRSFPAEGYKKATLEGKWGVKEFLEKIKAAGQTNVDDGLKAVLKRLGKSDAPSQVFVVLSGISVAQAKGMLTLVNKAKLPKTVKINTMYLGKRTKEVADVLVKIAAATGGSYRRVISEE
jgi:hypothetical protein